MKTQVKWVDNMTFLGTSGTQHHVIFDGNGDQSHAPTPMEMVLMSAGACASVDVVSLLKQENKQLTQCEVTVQGERVDSQPRIFKTIHLSFQIAGDDLVEAEVKTAVTQSLEKFCSVALMLAGKVEVSYDYQLVNQ